ncbi:peptide-methionine (S)-S-oxide reductase MsrA [Jannaschia sp. LMIT008]|uniref:peptide-methionine (S)-S-oxide reductase MsrA n=1 Tax=Jannaschia maritima TaxID=3032585 RepID=UPI002810AC94|nr:peptide-methionine (S)-S-oxide reductase MsrA [Jannaschia sp. LMIT008]
MDTKRLLPALAAALLTAAPATHAAEAIFAGGCFWCVEADFEKVPGVGDAVSGFTGGTTPDPVYRDSGDHIEAVRIPFDEGTVDYAQLVHMFLRSIDPLDAGGQFCDRGREYTTAIFATTPEQASIARDAVARAEADLGRSIVTPVLDASRFYPVDEYHQDYYKSDERIAFSSVGLAVPKSVAYERYRDRCGRDQRVRAVWGDAAPFAG